MDQEGASRQEGTFYIVSWPSEPKVVAHSAQDQSEKDQSAGLITGMMHGPCLGHSSTNRIRGWDPPSGNRKSWDQYPEKVERMEYFHRFLAPWPDYDSFGSCPKASLANILYQCVLSLS